MSEEQTEVDVPLEGDRDFGEICGSHQGCQVPFRPPIPNVAQGSAFFFFFWLHLGLCCFARFSLVAVNGGLHCCAVLAPHCCGFSCCGAQALDVRAQ